jgi:superfamily I DNA and RNA helicase
VTDESFGIIVIDVDMDGHDPNSREPFSRLNEKFADLRAEIQAVERVRPYRLVLFANHEGSLIGPPEKAAPRSLGVADVVSGEWVSRLESRPLESAHLTELRSALAPALCFEIRARQGTADPGKEERRRQQVILDAQQSAAATAPVDDVLMISGPPGCGKTLVLAGRARHLAAAHPDWRIVILCYNNALMPYLRHLVREAPNVEVATFGKFTRLEGHRFNTGDSRDSAGELARARRNGISRTVDALLIDEGQDFDDGWIGFALETVRPDRGNTVIARDERQSLYRPTPIAAAIAGRRVSSLRLERSYRSTRQILNVASTTQPKRESLRSGEALDGLPVELIWAKSWDEQAVAVAWEIRRHIDSGERAPEDIAILVTQWASTRKRLTAALEEENIPYLVVDRTNSDSFDARSPEVKIMTVHGAKGHEFDVAILFGLEALPESPEPGVAPNLQHGQRGNVAFVGMTRARDLLQITWTRPNPYLRRLNTLAKSAEHPDVVAYTWPDDYEV